MPLLFEDLHRTPRYRQPGYKTRRKNRYYWMQQGKRITFYMLGFFGGLGLCAIIDAFPNLKHRLNRWGRVTL